MQKHVCDAGGESGGVNLRFAGKGSCQLNMLAPCEATNSAAALATEVAQGENILFIAVAAQ